jgi:transposase-like protein
MTLNGLTSNVIYNLRITAQNSCGSSAPATITFITGVPVAPSVTAYYSVTCNSASVSWNATGATSYKVEYKKSSETAWTTATSNTTATNWTLNNLTANTIYNWRVTAQNSCGSSVAANGANFTTLALPTVPTGLSVSNIISNSATLKWNVVTGATSYKVEYKTYSATTWTTINTTAATYTLSSLTANTTYNWRVTAQNSCGSSAVVNGVNFTNSSTSTPAKSVDISIVESSEIVLYPNPVRDILHIKGLDKAVSPAKGVIFDLSGKIVKTVMVDAAKSPQINVSDLSSGTYILNISGKSLKFIKQ